MSEKRVGGLPQASYTQLMRRLRVIVCLAYCLSLMLMPASMLHAHVTADQHDHPHVHDGHSHDFAMPDTDVHEHQGHVVEINTSPDHGSNTVWWSWLPLPLALVFIGLCTACVGFIWRERRRAVRVPQQFPPWPPPLRGPPLSI